MPVDLATDTRFVSFIQTAVNFSSVPSHSSLPSEAAAGRSIAAISLILTRQIAGPP